MPAEVLCTHQIVKFIRLIFVGCLFIQCVTVCQPLYLAPYSAMRKKRYKPKFMFKGLKINFFRFVLGAFEKASKNGGIATKPKEYDQFAQIL